MMTHEEAKKLKPYTTADAMREDPAYFVRQGEDIGEEFMRGYCQAIHQLRLVIFHNDRCERQGEEEEIYPLYEYTNFMLTEVYKAIDERKKQNK